MGAKKRGRPRSAKSSDWRYNRLRKVWREASERYYRKNRVRILRKAHKKNVSKPKVVEVICQ